MDGFLDELNQAWLNLDSGQDRADFCIDTGFAGTPIIGDGLFDESLARSRRASSIRHSRPDKVFGTNASICRSNGSEFPCDCSSSSVPARNV